MSETLVGQKLKAMSSYDRDLVLTAGLNGGTVCAPDYETSLACHVMVSMRLMTDEGGDVFDLTGIGCAVASFLRDHPEMARPN